MHLEMRYVLCDSYPKHILTNGKCYTIINGEKVELTECKKDTIYTIVFQIKDTFTTLDKKVFFNGDGEFDTEHVFIGNIIPMRTADGQIVNAQVTEIGDKEVTIDLNHPYAGEDLHFVGEVIDLRDADPKELEAIRHPHKCGGCHGNCGDCESDCGKGESECGSDCGNHCGNDCKTDC